MILIHLHVLTLLSFLINYTGMILGLYALDITTGTCTTGMHYT